jgi:Neuraminidase (sialidase)
MDRPWGEVAAAVSLDYGLTWKEIGIVPLPEGMTVENFHEPHVYEAEDGRLVGLIRHQDPHGYSDLRIYQTESTDGGKTWSVPVLTEALKTTWISSPTSNDRWSLRRAEMFWISWPRKRISCRQT